MASDIRFVNDDSDITSSDEEYDANEKRLLKKYKYSQQRDSEDELEVFGVRSGDSDDESDKSEIASSDVEDNDGDGIPDARAWGREKRKYYGTDYVDPDYGGFDGKDAQAAEIEEEEAKHIQSQLVQQLDDNDFSLDVIFKSKDKKEAKTESEEVVKTDYTSLTNKQKIAIIQKESPEFFGLIEDFKIKMEIAQKYLKPAMEKFKSENAEMSEPVKFIETYYNLILNYVTNIYMYLLLKSSKELKNHPVIKTLYQYRQLLSKMEPVFDEVIKPQLVLILEENQNQKKPKEVKKLLKILSKEKTLKENKKKKEKVLSIQEDEASPAIQSDKKVRFVDQISDSNASDVDEVMKVNVEQENETEEVGKRGITYQIAKNKGLTPNRKKEYRNPRVKHKLKFRKALIRRKGAVREPRKELTRYGGEISGIKASVSKSIKIKS
ncbi:UTP3 small subunit processome component Sas10 [Rhynchophorus ferrugineus]|uniref:UTP3 small subunit processome component Sas10 n=1 Tax=Rhynchophorus ferrugineus TaxID=354439 RepID=UPI003FCCD408